MRYFNYIWVINNFIAYKGEAYIGDLTVCVRELGSEDDLSPAWHKAIVELLSIEPPRTMIWRNTEIVSDENTFQNVACKIWTAVLLWPRSFKRPIQLAWISIDQMASNTRTQTLFFL